MTQPSSVLLFAAGLGTRMSPLTKTMPKPLVSVAGQTLLDHAMQFTSDLTQVVNVHYKAEQINAHLKGQDVQISDETGLLRETGGGLKHALPQLGAGPVITMNTDAVWRDGNPIATLQTRWDADAMEALLLLVPKSNAVGHLGGGDFDIKPDGRISRGGAFVYTGVQIIKTEKLSAINEEVFSMWALWEGMLDRGTMYGAVFPGGWCDVGQPQSIALAEQMLSGDDDV